MIDGVEFIRHAQIDYAIIVRRAMASSEKYNFISPNSYPLQLGINFYEPGNTIKSHYHPHRQVTADTIQEFIRIEEGRVRMTLYDVSHQPFGSWVLEAGDSVLLVNGGHGFDVLEKTRLLEIKQGPFDPSTKDKIHYGN